MVARGLGADASQTDGAAGDPACNRFQPNSSSDGTTSDVGNCSSKPSSMHRTMNIATMNIVSTLVSRFLVRCESRVPLSEP